MRPKLGPLLGLGRLPEEPGLVYLAPTLTTRQTSSHSALHTTESLENTSHFTLEMRASHQPYTATVAENIYVFVAAKVGQQVSLLCGHVVKTLTNLNF